MVKKKTPKSRTRKTTKTAAPKRAKKKVASAKKKVQRTRPAKKSPTRAVTQTTRRPAQPPAVLTPPAPVSTPSPLPTPTEEKVGVVTHYYGHLGVAVVRLERGHLRVGETIHVKGHTSDFRQKVESIELEHQKIPMATVGQEFGLSVTSHAREGDEVYKVLG